MGAKRSKYADCDFKGWATKFGILCADGRIIQHGAFDDIDGAKVPLVYNHDHGNINSVLGHAYMECRKDGVYAYGYFNGSDNGQIAKDAVQHGDMDSLSIWANHLQQRGPYVQHGEIKELSLVLAGANPGAYIEDVALAHGDTIDNDDYEAYIYSGEYLEIMHSDEKGEDEVANKSIQDVVDTMTPEQKDAFYMAVGSALAEDPNALEDEDEYEDEDDYEDEDEEDDYDDDEDVEDPDKDDDDSEEYEEEDDDMGAIAHNLFEGNNTDNGDVLSHSEMQEIIEDGKRYGSMKESFLAHGITNIEYLFPDAKNLNTPPEFIARDQGWVTEVMNGVHHTPFSRIKSTAVDITADEARAKGYVKGNLKKEEIIKLLKRVTTPTTIYKKQKLDRDDIIDITDLDVVAWLKAEMRLMLDEELLELSLSVTDVSLMMMIK